MDSNNKDKWTTDGWTLCNDESNGISTGTLGIGGICLHSFKSSILGYGKHNSGYAVSPKFGVPENAFIKIQPTIGVFSYDAKSFSSKTETFDLQANKITIESFNISDSSPYISLDCDTGNSTNTDLYFYISDVSFEYN